MSAVRFAAGTKHMKAPDRQARIDYSKGPAAIRGVSDPSERGDAGASRAPARGPIAVVSALLVVAAAAGAVGLIVADFSTLYRVTVLTVTKTTETGHDRHSYALALIGVAALVCVVGAARGSLPATMALVVLGVLALVLGPIHDADVVSSTGLVSVYESASAHAGIGYRLELVGAILVLAGGGGRVLLDLPSSRGGVGRRRRRKQASQAPGEAPAALPANPFVNES